ncbi:uncharacterized protein EDB93DRAFT_1086241 [Suillus bovinus]|uniref:uncharacterized protein n=1 Tax=Suillus bovinus TaxID=48563 RepID=UPI001B87C800|nr:uncharacterized protein EDB93DRAFT_1086241 [Suillus bovinus]KAG2146458.1 hypothetical protein EDB93DRAFT_1086241 [Suillus bovinus]
MANFRSTNPCFASSSKSALPWVILNAHGQRNESLAWFWSIEVDMHGLDQSWNEECEFPNARHFQLHWLQAKALRDRWKEELMLVQFEMDWTSQWGDQMQESFTKRLPGHACYSRRQSRMYSLLAQDAQAAFQHLQTVLIDSRDE